jgi:hypothetical protein
MTFALTPVAGRSTIRRPVARDGRPVTARREPAIRQPAVQDAATRATDPPTESEVRRALAG